MVLALLQPASFSVLPLPQLHLCSLLPCKPAHKLTSGPARVTALLAKADLNWHQLHPSRLFGKSFHTPTPSARAKQLLGLNFLLATSKQFQIALTRLNAPTHPSSPPPPHIPGRNSATLYFSRLPPVRVVPGIQNCLATSFFYGRCITL